MSRHYKSRIYLNYVPNYDDFTIYVIIHGCHIGFIAARTVVLNEFLGDENMGQDI